MDCHTLKAERDENEQRKAFTVEEKLLLAQAISNGLGDRKGSNQYKNKLDTENSPEALSEYKHEETRDIAARESGLGSSATFSWIFYYW